jgi:hypothetical protein
LSGAVFSGGAFSGGAVSGLAPTGATENVVPSSAAATATNNVPGIRSIRRGAGSFFSSMGNSCVNSATDKDKNEVGMRVARTRA